MTNENLFNYRRFIRLQIPQKEDLTNYLGVLLSIFSIAGLTAFAIRPTLAKVISLRSEIVEGEKIKSDLRSKIGQVSEAQVNYLSAQPYLPLLDRFLPEKPDPVNLIKELESMSAGHELTLSRVSLDKISILGKESDKDKSLVKTPPKVDLLKTLPLTTIPSTDSAKPKKVGYRLISVPLEIEVEGKFDNLRSFLLDLKYLLSAITLEKTSFAVLNFAGSLENEKKDFLILSIKGNYYYAVKT